jgi:hypothetical protein
VLSSSELDYELDFRKKVSTILNFDELLRLWQVARTRRLLMNVIMVAIFVVIPFLWLYAELKLGRIARICLGLLSVVSVAILTYSFGQLGPAYESEWHRNSIKVAADLLAKGETNRVQAALDSYNSVVPTSSTFRASEAMWHVLKQAQTH